MFKDNLEEGIKIYKDGDKDKARKIFSEILKSNPKNERAWIWLAAASENNSEKINYLKKAQELNPQNEQIQLAINKLEQKISLPIKKEKRKFPYWIIFIPILAIILFLILLPKFISKNLNQAEETPVASILQISPTVQNTKVVLPTLIPTIPSAILSPSETLLPSSTPLPTETMQPTLSKRIFVNTQAAQPIPENTCPSYSDQYLHAVILQNAYSMYQVDYNYYHSIIDEATRTGGAAMARNAIIELNNANTTYENTVKEENTRYANICNH